MSGEPSTEMPQKTARRGVTSQKAQSYRWRGNTQNGGKMAFTPKTDSGKDKETFYSDITCFWFKQMGHYASVCNLSLQGPAATNMKGTTKPLKVKKSTVALMQEVVMVSLQQSLGGHSSFNMWCSTLNPHYVE